MTAIKITSSDRLAPEEYQRVLSFFERAVQEEPDRWSYWCDIGFCRGKLGQWHEAVAAFERVTDKTETSGSVLSMLGLAYLQLERYDDAHAVLQQAHALDPHNLNTLYEMAVACFRRGELEQALDPLHKIISRKPHHVKAQFSLGLIAHRLNNPKTAEQRLAILRDLDQASANRLAGIINETVQVKAEG